MNLIFLYLLIVSVIGVAIILIRIVSNQKHLDEPTLRLFMLNQLGEKERNRVIAHLGICEDCQEMLHEYNQGKPLEDHLINDEDH